MMMKNEKVLMKRKDFSEMRKGMDLNSSKEFQIENTNLTIDMFRWKPTNGGEFGESFSRFYIIDSEGNRKFGLCTLQELDYIEIDKENKRVTIIGDLIKTIVDEFGDFEQYWTDDGSYYKKDEKLGTKKCIICDAIIPMFSEVMCYSCEKKYEYNLETDKFEPIEDKVKAETKINEETINREIKEYQYYIDLFIEIYSNGDNYLNWLRILDSDIANGENKREVLYSIVADRRKICEELDDYNQEMFDLQILKTLLLRFSDQKIDMIFKDIRNQLFEQGMQEGCNL